MLPGISSVLSLLIAVAVVAAESLDKLALVPSPVIQNSIVASLAEVENTVTNPIKVASITTTPLISSTTPILSALKTPSTIISANANNPVAAPVKASDIASSQVEVEQVTPILSSGRVSASPPALVSADPTTSYSSPSTIISTKTTDSVTKVADTSASSVTPEDKTASSIVPNNAGSSSLVLQPTTPITEVSDTDSLVTNRIDSSENDSTLSSAQNAAPVLQSSGVKSDDMASSQAGVDTADKTADKILSITLPPIVDTKDSTSSILKADDPSLQTLSDADQSGIITTVKTPAASGNDLSETESLSESSMENLDENFTSTPPPLTVLDQTTERPTDILSKTSLLTPTSGNATIVDPVFGSLRTAHVPEEIYADEGDSETNSTTPLLASGDTTVPSLQVTTLSDGAIMDADKVQTVSQVIADPAVITTTASEETGDVSDASLAGLKLDDSTSDFNWSDFGSEGRTKTLDDDFFLPVQLPATKTFIKSDLPINPIVTYDTAPPFYHQSSVPLDEIVSSVLASSMYAPATRTAPISNSVQHVTSADSPVSNSDMQSDRIQTVNVATQVQQTSLQDSAKVDYSSIRPVLPNVPSFNLLPTLTHVHENPTHLSSSEFHTPPGDHSPSAGRSKVSVTSSPTPVVEPSYLIPVRSLILGSSNLIPAQLQTTEIPVLVPTRVLSSPNVSPASEVISSNVQSEPNLSTPISLSNSGSLEVPNIGSTSMMNNNDPASPSPKPNQVPSSDDRSGRPNSSLKLSPALVASLSTQSVSAGLPGLEGTETTTVVSQTSGDNFQSGDFYHSSNNDGAPDTAWLQPVLVTASPSSSLADPDASSTPQSLSSAFLIPSGVPKAVIPAVQPQQKKDSKPFYIAFEEGLNYNFVVGLTSSSAQIFGLLPYVLSYAIPGLSYSDFPVERLIPEESSDKTYVATVAKVFVPAEYHDQLAALIKDQSSNLYRNPDSVQRALANVIDPHFDETSVTTIAKSPTASPLSDVTSGSPTNNGSLGENVTASTGSKATSTAGIAVGAAAGSIIYLGLMVLLFKKLKNSRKAPLALSDSESGRSSDSDLYFFNFHSSSDRHMSHPSTFTHLNLGSTQTQNNLKISAPVKATNSLGWNLR